MKKLKVIDLQSNNPSFSYNNGLFAIYKTVDRTLHLWKIKDGKLDMQDNNTPNIFLVDVQDKAIKSTDLLIYTPKVIAKQQKTMQVQLIRLDNRLVVLFLTITGEIVTHIFNAPSENIDHVDQKYLFDKFNYRMCEEEIDFLKNNYRIQYRRLFGYPR